MTLNQQLLSSQAKFQILEFSFFCAYIEQLHRCVRSTIFKFYSVPFINPKHKVYIRKYLSFYLIQNPKS